MQRGDSRENEPTSVAPSPSRQGRGGVLANSSLGQVTVILYKKRLIGRQVGSLAPPQGLALFLVPKKPLWSFPKEHSDKL